MQFTVKMLSCGPKIAPTHFFDDQGYDLGVGKIYVIIHSNMLGNELHQVFTRDAKNIINSPGYLLPFQLVFILGQVLEFSVNPCTLDHVFKVSGCVQSRDSLKLGNVLNPASTPFDYQGDIEALEGYFDRVIVPRMQALQKSPERSTKALNNMEEFALLM